MTDIDIQALVASRLEDMADRIDELCRIGDHETALFLREEGLYLAEVCDNGETFMYLNDLRMV